MNGNLKSPTIFYLYAIISIFFKMKPFRNIIVLLSSVLILHGCLKINTDGVITSVVVNTSECKGSAAGAFYVLKSQDSGKNSGVLYNYNPEEEELSITHLNAGINCCREAIITRSIISKDTLIITEGERGEGCKCLCLVDIDFIVKGVKAGSYILKIEEPYSGEQAKIIFPLNLNQNPYGTFFVQRSSYPWM